MTDLYDSARNVRDAALAEVNRMERQSDVSPDVRAANVLGVHLAAVLMAFVADRCKTIDGKIEDGALQGVMAMGVAVMIGNMAVNFRPMIDGHVVPPSVNVHFVLQAIATETFRQVAHAEAGLQDFNVQFQTSPDGALTAKAFDFNSLMKGQS